MIYFDNAATTLQKPRTVARAVSRAIGSLGNVGRGVNGASLAAGTVTYETRMKVAKLFGARSASCVAFTSNATEALNTALAGLLRPGDHVITTAASHNSVLRPLYRLREQDVELSIAPIAEDGSLNYKGVEALFKKNTAVLAVTHASNLTGDVYDIDRLALMAHEHNAVIVVDAAQTAGVLPIDVDDQDIDVLCFTGHKSLYGPQGTGGLVVSERLDIRPLKVGGSGTNSYDEEHPFFMPERLEAGTLNAHGIAGLGAGIDFINKTGIDALAEHEQALAERFLKGLREIDGVKVYGLPGDIGIVALNVRDLDSGEVSDRLSTEFDIATRAGAHCAPLMHRALGTEHQGAVRFSFSWFNTEDEIDQALEALTMLCERFRALARA